MSFCSRCGQKIAEGAQFCSGCGEKIGMQPISQEKNIEKQEQRKVAFDGEVHKCPNCGEVIKKSFQTVCHKCNFELRSVNSSKAVRELNERLELANNEKKKIEIIKNFPIPNTKEDIFEFMILASSNFDASYYATHLQEEDISDAWLVKIEQCYQKAKLILQKNEIERIEELYLEIKSNISKLKLKNKTKATTSVLFIVLGIGLMMTGFLSVVGLGLLIVGIVMISSNKKKNETEIVHKNNSVTKTGFSSWSITAKVFWIILNIYTIGIPAIIYACTKKK